MPRQTLTVAAFLAGGIFTIVDAWDFTITGLFLLGVTCFVIGAWLIGAFTSGFWLGPHDPNDLSTLDRLNGTHEKDPA